MKKMLLASVILLGLVGCGKTGENDYLLKYETTATNTHTVVIKKVLKYHQRVKRLF